jgi:hypothetical protein
MHMVVHKVKLGRFHTFTRTMASSASHMERPLPRTVIGRATDSDLDTQIGGLRGRF